jgi:hypothetical protein
MMRCSNRLFILLQYEDPTQGKVIGLVCIERRRVTVYGPRS